MSLHSIVRYGLFQTRIGMLFFNKFRKLFVRLERAFQLHQLLVRPNAVRSGPFEGLIYSKAEYSLWERKRLIGSYESCLHDTIRSFAKLEGPAYEKIIVIGCAEGYYAIGLAKCFPKVPVLAVDVDEAVLSLTESMAKANGVEKNVTLSNKDAIYDLLELGPNERTLIVCDCEGCEFAIFDGRVIPNLVNSDLIIEMHYSEQLITTSGGAREPIIPEREFSGRFIESHNIEHIIPRENKADDYVLGYLPVIATKEFLFETRDKDAEWLVLRSKSARR